MAAGRPVLILLDEIMDYAMALAGPAHRETIPDEQAFLNALPGVVAEVSGVDLVAVMIRSDLDEQGYEGAAQEFRSYLAQRLERNGTTVSVNEPQDFGAIIRRRIFARPTGALPIAALTKRWNEAATSAWREHVFDRLPGARQLAGFRGAVGPVLPVPSGPVGPGGARLDPARAASSGCARRWPCSPPAPTGGPPNTKAGAGRLS